MFPIPADYQLFVALIIGVIVAIPAVFKFFSDLKKPAAAPVPEHIRVLGAALGDSQALVMIADELRQIRVLWQRHLENEHMDAEIERRVEARVTRILRRMGKGQNDEE